MLAGDHLGAGHAFVLGLVRQHRAGDAVADRVDARRHWSASARRSRSGRAWLISTPSRRQPQPVGIGLAPGGDAARHRRPASPRCRPCAACSVSVALPPFTVAPCTAAPMMNFSPCFSRMRFRPFCTSPSMPGVIASRYSTTVTSAPSRAIDRAQFQPDHPGADHRQRLRHLGQIQRAGGGDDHLLVDLDPRQRRGHRAGGDHDRLGRRGSRRRP